MPLNSLARQNYLGAMATLSNIDLTFPRGSDFANTVMHVVHHFQQQSKCACIIADSIVEIFCPFDRMYFANMRSCPVVPVLNSTIDIRTDLESVTKGVDRMSLELFICQKCQSADAICSMTQVSVAANCNVGLQDPNPAMLSTSGGTGFTSV